MLRTNLILATAALLAALAWGLGTPVAPADSAPVSRQVVSAVSAPVNPVAGTRWHFTAASGAVEFRPDGVVAFDQPPSTGHWHQEGDEVLFDCNDFTQYAVRLEGDHARGNWRRLKGPDVGTGAPTSLGRLR